jgi:hypothetical protein
MDTLDEEMVATSSFFFLLPFPLFKIPTARLDLGLWGPEMEIGEMELAGRERGNLGSVRDVNVIVAGGEVG